MRECLDLANPTSPHGLLNRAESNNKAIYNIAMINNDIATSTKQTFNEV